MFRTLDEFISEWKEESAATKRVLNNLTDDSLQQRVIPDYRTLGQMAWHLICTYHEMLSRTGLQFTGPEETDAAPTTAIALADAYQQVGEAMLNALKTQWTDATLTEQCNLYGEEWANSTTLRVLLQHEIHHRAQMTVLMRLAGVPVPGVYGPSKEEWSTFGMEAPTV